MLDAAAADIAGDIKVRVPRVISCLCTPEPLDDNDDSADLRFSECPIEVCYRGDVRRSSHTCVRSKVLAFPTGPPRAMSRISLGCTHYLTPLFAEKHSTAVSTLKTSSSTLGGSREPNTVVERSTCVWQLTVVTAVPLEEVRRFEVIAGRVECEGIVARRFACALQRPTLTRVLIAAALDQCGWVHSTLVDVVADGARGMRSLVTSVAPCVAPRILDWFHIGMKLHAVRSALSAYTFPLD